MARDDAYRLIRACVASLNEEGQLLRSESALRLLLHGADPLARDARGATPVDAAEENGFANGAAMLSEATTRRRAQ